MYCPNCKQEYDGKFCPECGTKLIEKPATSGVSLNLGDANAVSGGLHVNDSHAVHNEDRSVHNITNTTSTVNNITQVSAQKTEREILQEHKTQFLNACKRAYEDNVLNQKEIIELQELRIKLGLDEKTAEEILVKVKAWSDRNARKSDLNPIAKTKLRILTDNLQKNEVKALMDQIDSLEPLLRRFDHDELSRKYYLVLAALKPEKCIARCVSSKTDIYWESFWSYLAHIKAGYIVEADSVLASLDRFQNYPEDNMTILAAAGALMKGHPEEAKEYLDATTGEYTPALQRFVDSLYLLLAPQKAKKSGADENTCAFYLVNFFGQKDPKAKAEEERIRKAKEEEEAKRKAKEEEAKRKAKEAEKARKRAEEVRRRLEAERKAKEEAIRKAKEAEEAKRCAEEAKRRAEVEAIRKAKEAEEAKRRREEEERRRQAEEAERRRKEEERRKKEAERRAEEEAKRRAEEAKRRAEEEKALHCFVDKLAKDMVWVDAGTFMMGTTYYTRNISTKPAHRVKLSPYKICRYEVTLEQWLTVMGSNPTTHRDKKRPVVGVSWSDCQEFISKLNAMSNMKFRLPTEAEWEFAALGGVKSRGFHFAGSDKLEDVAWTCQNSGDRPLEAQKYEFDFWDEETLKNNHCRTHDVGQKKPNELGLYDMCGNVWEWCADWYGDYCASDQENPKGPTSGTERVQRGGCYWVKEPADVKKRSSGESNKGWNNVGFRLALDPTPEDLAIIEEKEKKFKAAIKSYNGHDYVDLGLPSGTLWATCNIGASKPEEFGNYFSWGETTGYDEGKREFDDEHYKFRIKKRGLFSSKWVYTKYCENKENGSVDNKLCLEKDDDAAYVQWGKGWRMPTTAQFEELINKDYTIIEISFRNGIRGLQITSKANGGAIFLPAGGSYSYAVMHDSHYETNKVGSGNTGSYWTKNRLSGSYKSPFDVYFNDHDDCANSLYFSESDEGELSCHIDNNEKNGQLFIGMKEPEHRCYGYNIRPVCSKE